MEAFDIINLCLHVWLLSAKTLQAKHKLTVHLLSQYISCLCSDAIMQVDRVSYLLQEIYGIENKNNQETKVNQATVPNQ